MHLASSYVQYSMYSTLCVICTYNILKPDTLSKPQYMRSGRENIQSNLVKTNFRVPTKLVLIIRSSSYQDIVIHVQYYSKPNRAWKLVCIKQKFALTVFLLTKFYCIQFVRY